ncbi:MAG: SGNH/GDSL hydrolase family protein [Oscillospiraceae bacterium]|nr:SGNH/GDSL hydrolase family protein [Oscillospiraceae bacterium]
MDLQTLALAKKCIEKLEAKLDCVASVTKVWLPVKFETVVGKTLTFPNGDVSSSTSSGFNISDPVPVAPGEQLLITASKDYANFLYVFYAENGTVVKKAIADGYAKIEDELVTVPAGASTLRISFCYNNIGQIKRLIQDGGMKLQPWKGRVWTVVGDSLTEKNSRTDMNYHDYIAEATGITVVNLGYSGSGYAKSGQGKAFHLRITNVPSNSDAVTIFGSFNDLSADIELGTPSDTGTETICGCINTTIDNLIAVMPSVSLGIVTPTAWQSGNPADPNNAQTKYADALIEICNNRSIPCLDLYRCSNLRPWTEEGRVACYGKDDGAGCHPDENGHKLIAGRFKAFLESLIV